MGICCFKDDAIHEKRVLLDEGIFEEGEDMRESGLCDWCQKSSMIRYDITKDHESLCNNCEFLYAVLRGRGGLEQFYDIDLNSD